MRRQKELKKHKLSLSQEEFLKRMNIVFGNFYDFSESVYINLLTKVKCICPKHGEHLDRDVNAAINIKNIAFDKQNLVGV